MQIDNVDYTQSSYSCPSSVPIKLVLAVANQRGLPLYHFDVAQGCIRASLDEEVYMKPLGDCGEKSKKTAMLERPITGLKKRGCKGGHLCTNTLIAYSFEQCKADQCISRKIVDGVVAMIIGVYMDVLLGGGSQENCKSLVLSLNKTFSANGLGECTWYERCGIEKNAEFSTIKFSQEAYVKSSMAHFDVRTAFDTRVSPVADLWPKRDDKSGGDWPVRKTVRSLLWLYTMTRLNITNSVRAVARYAYTRSERLWQVLLKISSYLNGTKNFGITYVRGSSLGLEVYADADFVDKANNGRSVSGIAVTLGGTVASSTSKTQHAVSLSTSEAEYIAGGDGVK